MSTLQEIEKAALQLTPGERETLASHLFQSVHDQDINEIDAAWLDESEKRYQEFLKDPSTGIRHTDHFFDDIKADLGWK